MVGIDSKSSPQMEKTVSEPPQQRAEINQKPLELKEEFNENITLTSTTTTDAPPEGGKWL